MVRTPASHAGSGGSNPPGITILRGVNLTTVGPFYFYKLRKLEKTNRYKLKGIDMHDITTFEKRIGYWRQNKLFLGYEE